MFIPLKLGGKIDFEIFSRKFRFSGVEKFFETFEVRSTKEFEKRRIEKKNDFVLFYF